MELTQEQKDILKTLETDDKVIKINAYAGSGKSSQLVELAKKIRETDKTSKILYVVFNRSMLDEAKRKFEGLDVECQTTHGFALKRFSALKKGEMEVIPSLDFNLFMELKNKPKYSKKWVRFKVVNELLNQFCLTYDDIDTYTSNIYKKNNYELVDKPTLSERDFFIDLYNYMIDKGYYTHGLYLKLYACECRDKITSYKYVFLDECQDTSRMFYNILKRIKYDKLYCVGDFYQSIYQFCKIVNIFDKLDGKTFNLSYSFRINDKGRDLANKILSKRYKNFPDNAIKNYFNKTELQDKKKKTILFRLNSTMFEYAVRLISEVDNIKVHFMDVNSNGNTDKFEECFNDMLYFYYHLLECHAPEKAEVFYNTYRFKPCKLINDFMKVAQKENMSLYHYLARNIAVLPLDFKKYFDFYLLNEFNLLEVIEKVKNSETCKNPNKEYFLSTAHRYKGLEAEHVKIAPDKWSLSTDAEANLCYVACTRATTRIDAEPIEELLD